MDKLWHSIRAKHIGGSEIAALFGECPYGSAYQTWQEKKGNVEPKNLDKDERVQAGKFKEPSIIAWANYKWSKSFCQPDIYQKHASVKGMGCTPDAFEEDNANVMAQIKNVDNIRFAQEWDCDGDVITKAPLDILLQVQHEMDCTGRRECWLIVEVGGNRLLYMVCHYDAVIANTLRTAIIKFWQTIADNEAPDPDFKKDRDVINVMRRKLAVTKVLDLEGNKYFNELSKECLKKTVERNRLVDSIDAINAEICHLVGNAELVKCDDIVLKFYKHRNTPKIIKQGVGI